MMLPLKLESERHPLQVSGNQKTALVAIGRNLLLIDGLKKRI